MHFHVVGCFNLIVRLYNMTHIIIDGTDLDVFAIIRHRKAVWKMIWGAFAFPQCCFV